MVVWLYSPVRLSRTIAERCCWLYFGGNLLLFAGLICNHWMPINKKLWTPSFTLFMAGLDFTIFAMFLWCVDGLGYRRVVKPLVIMGMNAIAVYLASEFLDEGLSAISWRSAGTRTNLHHWLYTHLFAWYASPVNASLLFAIAYTLLMFGIAYVMYRRGWFLRV